MESTHTVVQSVEFVRASTFVVLRQIRFCLTTSFHQRFGPLPTTTRSTKTTMPNLVVAALLLLWATGAGTAAATTTTTTPTITTTPTRPSSSLLRRRRGSTRQFTASRRLVDPYPCTTAEFCAQPNGGCYGGYCRCDFSYGYDADSGQCLPGGCGDLGYFCENHQVCAEDVVIFDQKTYSCTTVATPAPTPAPSPSPAGGQFDDDGYTTPPPTAAPTTNGGGDGGLSPVEIVGIVVGVIGVLVALGSCVIGIPACCLACLQLKNYVPP